MQPLRENRILSYLVVVRQGLSEGRRREFSSSSHHHKRDGQLAIGENRVLLHRTLGSGVG